ncbi:MAG: ribbon-helix-helix domain-containing protein [Parvibaculum sp.]
MTGETRSAQINRNEINRTEIKRSQIKRSLTIAGHRTSITLEQPFWDELKKIACTDKISVTELVRRIDTDRKGACSLTSAIRVFILNRVKNDGACSTSTDPA